MIGKKLWLHTHGFQKLQKMLKDDRLRDNLTKLFNSLLKRKALRVKLLTVTSEHFKQARKYFLTSGNYYFRSFKYAIFQLDKSETN